MLFKKKKIIRMKSGLNCYAFIMVMIYQSFLTVFSDVLFNQLIVDGFLDQSETSFVHEDLVRPGF